MFGKGSKVYAVTKMKCPRCHEGDLFKSSNPYKLREMANMYTRCPVCNQAYEPEPNFYYGSMYVSYAYTVAIFVAVVVLVKVILNLNMWYTLGALALVLLLTGPYLFRLSRATWLALFVKYKPPVSKE